MHIYMWSSELWQLIPFDFWPNYNTSAVHFCLLTGRRVCLREPDGVPLSAEALLCSEVGFNIS